MQIKVFPKQYLIKLEGWNGYDEAYNTLELSEEQFRELFIQMCNIADAEGFLVNIINEYNSIKKT